MTSVGWRICAQLKLGRRLPFDGDDGTPADEDEDERE
jgi:hypothetical protein